jgi:CheY-like chemotaxis protein
VPTDLRVVVRNTERMIARLVGETIRVVTDLASEPTVCVIDPFHLSQALVNLAINGRDAMPNGGTLRLEVSRIEQSEPLELPAASYALVSVSDVGVGMAPDVVARAFEPFFTTKAVGKGTGLGLSMCYGVIHQAGGRIAIDSEVGRGTTVKIYLPLVSELSERRPIPSSTVERCAETLLLVDDEASLRTLGKRILEQSGYRVFVASNGREALEVVQRISDPLALVVTDVMMPEMGGQELAIALRKIRPATRILYVSGFTANVVVTPGTAFLAKPFTGPALRAAVRQVLDRDEE